MKNVSQPTSFKLPMKQIGISLLEVMMSLAVIAVILVMATRYYKNAQMGQQVSNAMSIVGGIVAAETQFAINNKGQYIADGGTCPSAATPTGTTAVDCLQAMGLLPGNFGNDPWGNIITITITKGTPGFTVGMAAVPQMQCVNLDSNLKNLAYTTSGCATNPQAYTASFS